MLKPEQEKTINNLVNGRDVMAILPTGFGKSMICTVFALAKEISSLKTCDCHCPFEKYYRWSDFRNVVAKLHGNRTYDGSSECGSRESTSISLLLRWDGVRKGIPCCCKRKQCSTSSCVGDCGRRITHSWSLDRTKVRFFQFVVVYILVGVMFRI